MKILLYNLIHAEDFPNEVFVPLAYVLLEGYILRHANNVDVFRYDHIIDDPESRELCNPEDYDIAGFQLTFANIKYVMDMLKRWRKKSKAPFIVLGGVLASSMAEELMEKYDFIDSVIVGEGEKALLQLAMSLNGEMLIKDIPGILYRGANGETLRGIGKKRLIDLNSSPIAKRNFIRSLSEEEIKKTSIRIETARGCLGKCSFCFNSYKNRIDKLSSQVWRGMRPERVVDEIEYLYHEYGFRLFNFVDATFEDPGRKGKERIRKIAELIIKRDLMISYKVNMRAETFSNEDDDLLKLLKYSGMDVIILGIEAATDEELKLLGKNTNSQKMTEYYTRLRNMDCFFVLVGFISIHPYATLQSLVKSFDYVNKIGKSYSFNIFSCALIPLRGTNIYDKMLDDGLILNHEELFEVPRYRFRDKGVSLINDGIQRMKTEYPILSKMNRTLFHAFNVDARSTNRFYKKFFNQRTNSEAFNMFKMDVQNISDELSNIYYSIQKFMINLAQKGWDAECLMGEVEKNVVPSVESLDARARKVIKTYVQRIADEGFDVSMLLMEPWGSHCQERTKIGDIKED